MEGRQARPLSGVLNVAKPGGMTSRAVVDRVARLCRGRKVGHAGTLDPLASGVLVICVGTATRLIEQVQALRKTYRTVVRLGARSDTLDADGQVAETPEAVPPDESAVRAALPVFVGTIAQVPPQYSALKVGGRRAYDLARAGTEVELAARPVHVYLVDLLRYRWPEVELEIECGGGTYIRSIARDLGEALGTGGLVQILIRTRIGPFALEDALEFDALSPESLQVHFQPPLAAVNALPRRVLSEAEVGLVRQGRHVPRGPDLGGEGEAALVDSEGGLIAIARISGTVLQPVRVLAD